MTTDEVRRSIKEAIGKKRSIAFTFNKKEREGDPYFHGYLKDDNEAVRVYQTGGASVSGLKKDGSPADFRLFLLKDITDITVLRSKFSPRKDYNTKDKDFNLKKPHDNVK